MNNGDASASVFNKLAQQYRDKYMDLTIYDATYRKFCELLNKGHARVLDAACGPGNVSRFLMAQLPELDLLGIDLAPRMVELAQAEAPSAQFKMHDCRRLLDLGQRFDGIVCAFGLPYLSSSEVVEFVRSSREILDADGVLYLSFMEGKSEDSGFQTSSSGDRMYINYHSEPQIRDALLSHGFTIAEWSRLSSPSNAPKPTTDVVVIAKNQK
ncbi:MAG TPA: methyltransferase domain-containing protein [Burkholderiaceae bacterium]|jgi:predicted TPR repeat methyltransferase|nr:methyltransferase domain-containing protein [Burkholderiaceae bacterium]